MEKNIVDYIMNGDPGIPDEELPVPEMPEEKQVEEKATDKWTKAREMHAQGASDNRIATEYGVSGNTIWNWRKKEGLPPNVRTSSIGVPRKKATPPSVQEQINAKQPELTKRELSAEMKADIYEAKKTCDKMQESMPDSQFTSLAALTLKILLLVWKRIGKEESI